MNAPSPREFLNALDAHLGLRFALAGLTIPLWIAPLACLAVWGLPEQIIVPALLIGLIPFQYACFCILQFFAPAPRSINLGDFLPPEAWPMLAALAQRVNAIHREAERQQIAASPEVLNSALLATLLGGLNPVEAIWQQRAEPMRRQRALMDWYCFSSTPRQMSTWPRRQQTTRHTPPTSQVWSPPKPPMAQAM